MKRNQMAAVTPPMNNIVPGGVRSPSSFVTNVREVYNYSDYISSWAVTEMLEKKVYPAIRDQEMHNTAGFKILINVVTPDELVSCLSTVCTCVGRFYSVLYFVGDGFAAELTVKHAVNCLQITVMYWSSSSCTDVKKKFIDALAKHITKIDGAVIVDVDWMYESTHGTSTNDIREVISEVIHPEAYPYIDLDSLISGYLGSSASVLILTGVQGTGKTKLIRHIIRKAAECGFTKRSMIMRSFHSNQSYPSSQPSLTNREPEVLSPEDCGDLVDQHGGSNDTKFKVCYTTDIGVLKSEAFYIGLRCNDYAFAVLEDIDFKLGPRTDGNELMHKFLAMSDGFLTNSCKIIFSTNLNVGDIDPALLRTGRCYATIETRELTNDEAIVLAGKLDPEAKLPDKKKHSLADIYGAVYHNAYTGTGVRTGPIVGFGGRK